MKLSLEMKSSTPQQHGWILADGHVHIHDRFSEYSCLDWAVNNFNTTATLLELTGHIDHVLFLAESSSANWFIKQHNFADQGLFNERTSYRCTVTEENMSLCFENSSADRLFVIAGRQIISSERLEVLALGLVGTYPDGQPLRRIVSDIRESGCIAVLPWGAGKWLGVRRHCITSLLMDTQDAGLFLGDSGNRPSFWPLPAFFNPPEQCAPGNLPGSDPLPLTHQEKRIGSYGFLLQGPLDPYIPFQDLRKKLTEKTTSIRTFGEPEGLLPFLFNQTAMQLNRFGKS
jgi:hypothetical protein